MFKMMTTCPWQLSPHMPAECLLCILPSILCLLPIAESRGVCCASTHIYTYDLTLIHSLIHSHILSLIHSLIHLRCARGWNGCVSSDATTGRVDVGGGDLIGAKQTIRLRRAPMMMPRSSDVFVLQAEGGRGGVIGAVQDAAELGAAEEVVYTSNVPASIHQSQRGKCARTDANH